MSACKKCGGIVYIDIDCPECGRKADICNGTGESEDVMEKLCRENQEPEYYIKTTTGESDGLKEKSYFENWYESQTEIKERLTLEEVSFFISNRKFYDRPEIEVPHALKEMAILFEKRVKQARQDASEELEKELAKAKSQTLDVLSENDALRFEIYNLQNELKAR